MGFRVSGLVRVSGSAGILDVGCRIEHCGCPDDNAQHFAGLLSLFGRLETLPRRLPHDVCGGAGDDAGNRYSKRNMPVLTASAPRAARNTVTRSRTGISLEWLVLSLNCGALLKHLYSYHRFEGTVLGLTGMAWPWQSALLISYEQD